MFSFFADDEPNHPAITLMDDSANPLAPCPSSPNCVRRTYQISGNPEQLYSLILQALNQMNANIIDKSLEKFTAKAVFKIFFFKDDVSVSLEKHTGETLLHIRSASRKGHYDLGVNRRRINKFIERIGKKLK